MISSDLTTKQPNMFGIWLGDLMKIGKPEWHEVLPVNQQGALC